MYEATIAMTVCKAGMAGKYTFEFRPSCLRDGNVRDHGPALSQSLYSLASCFHAAARRRVETQSGLIPMPLGIFDAVFLGFIPF